MVVLMTVEPGFGGQSFLDLVLPKIRRARKAIEDAGVPIALQVDGGVAPDTIERAAEAGADVFVAGSAVYSAEDPAKAIDELRNLADRKSTRLNSSHVAISYAGFCLITKKTTRSDAYAPRTRGR